jgi:type 1 glutamine amidotransferase
MNPLISRRDFVMLLSAAAVAPVIGKAAQESPRQWLIFTKSAGFEHSVIKSDGATPSHLAACLRPLFEDRGLRWIESKDGRLFEKDQISRFAGFIFYTSGDLTTEGTDKQPPMSPQGKQNLLDAVASGVPFIGLHCASDTFHSPKEGPVDPFIQMVGGEFLWHGDQQVAKARVVDPNFPGVGQQADWTFNEEWYVLHNLASDLRPIHLLETAGMKGEHYQRDPFPLSWTRLHGRGRVFYTGLAHREDTVAGKPFLNLVGGAIDWCRG